MPDEFLTTRDLLKKYKITRTTLNQWKEDGLPFIKIGDNVWYKDKQVYKWLLKNKKI